MEVVDLNKWYQGKEILNIINTSCIWPWCLKNVYHLYKDTKYPQTKPIAIGNLFISFPKLIATATWLIQNAITIKEIKHENNVITTYEAGHIAKADMKCRFHLRKYAVSILAILKGMKESDCFIEYSSQNVIKSKLEINCSLLRKFKIIWLWQCSSFSLLH